MIKVKRPRAPEELSLPADPVKTERDEVLRFYKIKDMPDGLSRTAAPATVRPRCGSGSPCRPTATAWPSA